MAQGEEKSVLRLVPRRLTLYYVWPRRCGLCLRNLDPDPAALNPTPALPFFVNCLLMTQVTFPLVERLLFHYFLQWQTRYLIAWSITSLRIFTMKL